MTKTNFKRVCRMYKEGVSEEMCICIILGLTKNEIEAAQDINKFMQQEVFPRWYQHNFSRSTVEMPPGTIRPDQTYRPR